MGQHVSQRAVEPRQRRDVGFDDLLDRLNLAEVIAAAHRAQRGWRRSWTEVRLRRARMRRRRPTGVLRAPRRPFGQPVETQLARGTVKLEQAHAAADVRPHELGMDMIGQD